MTIPAQPKQQSLLIKLYLLFSKINWPLIRIAIAWRIYKRKEHPSRYVERLGHYSIPRPTGRIIWFNAASVGETLALWPLIEKILNETPKIHVLITTVTVTSAELLEKKLPKRAIHQFSPLDNSRATQAFLEHWKPDLAIWCESELWPRLLADTATLSIPMYLINARVSSKTKASWRKMPKTLIWAFSKFDKIFTQTSDLKEFLVSIGISKQSVVVAGSTKESSSELSYDTEELTRLKLEIGNRSIWVAGSTHAGEESFVINAHKLRMTNDARNSLLILAPRHPSRSNEISRIIKKLGLEYAQRSKGDPITQNTQIYLADTIGEMGLWFALSNTVFLGGSIANIGGHNPFEPIAMGCAIVTGPNVYNFSEIYNRLIEHEACIMIGEVKQLAQKLDVLENVTVRSGFVKRAQAAIEKDNPAAHMILAHLIRK